MNRKCGSAILNPSVLSYAKHAVADTDLQKGGGGHPDPEIREGGSQKNFFSALRASVWFKDKGGGGGRAPRTPPLDPSLAWSLFDNNEPWSIT